ncbi:XRE family transcriptional regulator [Streptomyces verrucosisporus]|uniref:XRE family transcriptional regulator n=1 Tax=Streptomyces verrucosisporus TaxID=1695161 RepID=UPI0019CF82C6|nr:XRE family transcriptional regulator [Streptomyces verrucosisporus]MBN3932592.1 XRE family transcriptional regulator [Streptomyces verrucosisporus]
MSDTRGDRTLAERLDRLFDTVRPEGSKGRRYTNEEVATAVKRADPGVRVGGAYLSALRKGTKKNPSTELLGALARFFGVPASYFLDERAAARTDAEIELAKVAHNMGVRKLALRALELSPEGLAAVTRIVEHVLESEPSARTRQEERPSAGAPDPEDRTARP